MKNGETIGVKVTDSIVDEIRGIRDSIAKQYDYDIAKIAESVRQEQETSGRTYVRLSPRTPAPLETEPDDPTAQRKSA